MHTPRPYEHTRQALRASGQVAHSPQPALHWTDLLVNCQGLWEIHLTSVSLANKGQKAHSSLLPHWVSGEFFQDRAPEDSHKGWLQPSTMLFVEALQATEASVCGRGSGCGREDVWREDEAVISPRNTSISQGVPGVGGGLLEGEMQRAGTLQAHKQPATLMGEWRHGAGAWDVARTVTSLSLSFLICKTRGRPPFSGFTREGVWKQSSPAPASHSRPSMKDSCAFLRCQHDPEQCYPESEVSWHSKISKQRLCSTLTGLPMFYFVN